MRFPLSRSVPSRAWSCDLDLVREADPEDLKLGYAVLVGTMLSSSKSRWNQFTETVPEILAGEEVALVNAVQWSQTSRKTY